MQRIFVIGLSMTIGVLLGTVFACHRKRELPSCVVIAQGRIIEIHHCIIQTPETDNDVQDAIRFR